MHTVANTSGIANNGSSVLQDINHGDLFAMNLVGSKIVDLLERGYTQAQIAEEIRTRFGISAEIVNRDVEEFVALLRQHQLSGADRRERNPAIGSAEPGSARLDCRFVCQRPVVVSKSEVIGRILRAEHGSCEEPQFLGTT